jgi:hypothetical protein
VKTGEEPRFGQSNDGVGEAPALLALLCGGSMRRFAWMLVAACGVLGAGVTASCGSDGDAQVAPEADAAPLDQASSEASAPDGSAPDVLPHSAGAVDPDAAAQAAVVLASCVADDTADGVLKDFYSRVFTIDYRNFVACIVSRKNGCQAIADCFHAQADLTGPCEDRCDGNVAEGCDGRLKYRSDCAFHGLACRTNTRGATTCAEPDASACDNADAGSRCSADGRPISCVEGFESKGPRCADFGVACSGGRCSGTEGACPAGSLSATKITFEGKGCSGSELKACVGGGLTTLDCGKLGVGASCQTLAHDGGARSYCGFGTACDPGIPSQPGVPASPTCDGDNVVVCNGGRVDRVDCKALGFTGCIAFPQALRPHALCTPSLKADAFAMHDGG